MNPKDIARRVGESAANAIFSKRKNAKVEVHLSRPDIAAIAEAACLAGYERAQFDRDNPLKPLGRPLRTKELSQVERQRIVQALRALAAIDQTDLTSAGMKRQNKDLLITIDHKAMSNLADYLEKADRIDVTA